MKVENRLLQDSIKKKVGLCTSKNVKPKTVFKNLVKHYCNTEIAKLLECSLQTVWLWKKDCGIPCKKKTFEDMIKEDGYETLSDFFLDPKITSMSFLEIGKKYKVSYVTVSKLHKRFIHERKVKNDKK